jgi:hypothetical protein
MNAVHRDTDGGEFQGACGEGGAHHDVRLSAQEDEERAGQRYE